MVGWGNNGRDTSLSESPQQSGKTGQTSQNTEMEHMATWHWKEYTAHCPSTHPIPTAHKNNTMRYIKIRQSWWLIHSELPTSGLPSSIYLVALVWTAWLDCQHDMTNLTDSEAQKTPVLIKLSTWTKQNKTERWTFSNGLVWNWTLGSEKGAKIFAECEAVWYFKWPPLPAMFLPPAREIRCLHRHTGSTIFEHECEDQCLYDNWKWYAGYTLNLKKRWCCKW